MPQYFLLSYVIDEWKRLSGRSDAELARLARLPIASLSRWRNGERPIRLEAAEAISEVTGIPRDRLVKRVDAAPRHIGAALTGAPREAQAS